MPKNANDDVVKARRRMGTTEPEWTFAQPIGVEFDTVNNRLIVVDTHRSRMQIYSKLATYTVPQLNL